MIQQLQLLRAFFQTSVYTTLGLFVDSTLIKPVVSYSLMQGFRLATPETDTK